jgi:hypothetical protein
MAAGGEHAERVLDRGALGDEVEHHLGACPAGDLAYAVDVPSIGFDTVVRPALLGQRQRLRVAVDGDDLGRSQRAEALDADVAQPARADHHGPVGRPWSRPGRATVAPSDAPGPPERLQRSAARPGR